MRRSTCKCPEAFHWPLKLIFSHFSTIGNDEALEFYELHICIKDYCFAREDRLVGVALLQLKDIIDAVRVNWEKISPSIGSKSSFRDILGTIERFEAILSEEFALKKP